MKGLDGVGRDVATPGKIKIESINISLRLEVEASPEFSVKAPNNFASVKKKKKVKLRN